MREPRSRPNVPTALPADVVPWWPCVPAAAALTRYDRKVSALKFTCACNDLLRSCATIVTPLSATETCTSCRLESLRAPRTETKARIWSTLASSTQSSMLSVR